MEALVEQLIKKATSTGTTSGELPGLVSRGRDSSVVRQPSVGNALPASIPTPASSDIDSPVYLTWAGRETMVCMLFLIVA
jgi:hypothetical protein